MNTMDSLFHNEDKNNHIPDDNELLRDIDLLKTKIYAVQSEIDNCIMEAKYLESWKKGRAVGFVLMLIASIVLSLMVFPYVDIWGDSQTGSSFTRTDALMLSVSSTALIFGCLILVVAYIITFVLGIKAIGEAGNSMFAIGIAHRFGLRNYYENYDRICTAKRSLDIEMNELQEEMKTKKDLLGEQ